jgi:hypothetical protein
MKFIEKFTFLVFLLSLFICLSSQNKIKETTSIEELRRKKSTKSKAEIAGARVGISEEFVLKLQKKYLPPYLEEYKNIKVPDMDFTLEGSFVNTYISVKNIDLHFGNLKVENIKVSFSNEDTILMTLKDVSLLGTLDASQKTMGIPVWTSATVEIPDIDLDVKVKTGMKKMTSSTDNEITLEVVEIKVNDFHVKVTLNSGVLDYIKSYFDKTIQDKILQAAKDNIVPNSKVMNEINKNLRERILNQIKYKVDITPGKIYTNYSLLDKPLIKNGVLQLYIDGGVRRHSVMSSGFEVGSLKMPEFTSMSKMFKLQISQYTINSLFKSFFEEGLLTYTYNYVGFTTQALPKKHDILFLLPDQIIRRDLIKKFGDNFVTSITVVVVSKPTFTVSGGQISSQKVELELSLSSTNLKTSKIEEFVRVKFWTPFTFVGKVGQYSELNGEINNVKIHDLKISKNLVEFLFDGPIIQSIVNDHFINDLKNKINTVLSGFKIPLPPIDGFLFGDSTIELEKDGLSFNYNLTFAPKIQLKRTEASRDLKSLMKKTSH